MALLVKEAYSGKGVQYLGTHVDYTLSDNTHRAKLMKKLKRANGTLTKVRHFVPCNDYQYIPCYLLIPYDIWIPSVGPEHRHSYRKGF